MCPSISIHVQFEILVHATLKGEVGTFRNIYISILHSIFLCVHLFRFMCSLKSWSMLRWRGKWVHIEMFIFQFYIQYFYVSIYFDSCAVWNLSPRYVEGEVGAFRNIYISILHSIFLCVHLFRFMCSLKSWSMLRWRGKWVHLEIFIFQFYIQYFYVSIYFDSCAVWNLSPCYVERGSGCI